MSMVSAAEISDRHRWKLPGKYLYFKNIWQCTPLFGALCIILLPPILTKYIYKYSLGYIIYLGEPSGNIISNYHGIFIHISIGPTLSTRGNLAHARARVAGSPRTVKHRYLPGLGWYKTLNILPS